jgi:capsular polysaccharide biosynthesis protein
VSIIYVLFLPDLYRSHGTFIIRPISSIELSEDLVNAIDTLSRRVEINSTYAEIASSRNVKNKVLENLNLSRDDVKNLQIDGNTIPGTNVLEISVIANSPEFASTVAAEVAKENNYYPWYRVWFNGRYCNCLNH